ncbi:MAG: hypothetical protein RLZZ15_2537, partial [Verrucomicrobiota bacterium]
MSSPPVTDSSPSPAPEKSASAVSRPIAAALGTGAALLGFVAWEQSFWWRTLEDYRFGWLAPAFVAYAVWFRWSAIRAAARACQADRGAVRAMRVAVAGVFGGATLLFLLGAVARARAGPSHPASVMVALGAGAMALSLVYLAAP